MDISKTSQLKPDTLAKWMGHKITGELTEVPFIGPAVEKSLKAAGVENTFQLCGQFLSFKTMEKDSQAVCDAFVEWLKAIKVNTGRANISLCVGEKCGLAFPGVFDRTELITGDGGEDE